jgi:hypothetical protein
MQPGYYFISFWIKCDILSQCDLYRYSISCRITDSDDLHSVSALGFNYGRKGGEMLKKNLLQVKITMYF